MKKTFVRGFTIVELTIYSGILIIFLFVLTTAFAGVLETHLASQATSAVVYDGKFIFSRLAYDIGRSEAIVIPANLGEQTTALTLTIQREPVTYSVTNGNLTITKGAATDPLNSALTRVSGLTFRRYGNQGGKNSVRVSFRLESIDQRTTGPEVRQFQATLGLR